MNAKVFPDPFWDFAITFVSLLAINGIVNAWIFEGLYFYIYAKPLIKFY